LTGDKKTTTYYHIVGCAKYLTQSLHMNSQQQQKQRNYIKYVIETE